MTLKNLQKTYRPSANESWLNDELSHQDCIISACDIDLFFGRFPISKSMWDCLLTVAEQVNLKNKTEQLFAGEVVNQSEHLAATHTQSRQDYLAGQENWNAFHGWVAKLRSGEFDDVIHLGTGGSRLGPELLIDALKAGDSQPFRPHFISSHDDRILLRLLAKCSPKKTLVIVASKSFSTRETLHNASLARTWLGEVDTHLLAITAKPDQAIAWGIRTDCCLTIAETIGGRYSISSPVSLIAAAYLGEAIFSGFMTGMVDMDQHFLQANWSKNLPVVFALLAVWAINFLSIPTRAILPYAPELTAFVPYIQQLSMESLGKNRADMATGSITWGGVGSDSQHSFHQLIMQGSHRHQVDFIASKDHPMSWKNALAQAQVMQRGNELSCNAAIKGGHPSCSLFLPSINPHTLGVLIALYEHQCFVKSILWEINCFDQPGVETGKKLLDDLSQCADTSTQELQNLCDVIT